MQVVGASPIGRVLSPELPQVHGAHVAHDGSWCHDELVPRLPPAVAEVAIFGRGERKGGVEPAKGEEGGAGARDVGGHEPAGVIGVGVVVAIEIVPQLLTGFGAEALRGAVHEGATNEGAGALLPSRRERRQPVGLRYAVVVKQGEVVAGGVLGADVAGLSRPAVPGHVDEANLERAREGIDDICWWIGAAIVDDNDLELLTREIQLRDAVQAGAEAVLAEEGRDDDGELDAGSPDERALRGEAAGQVGAVCALAIDNAEDSHEFDDADACSSRGG